MIKKAALTVIIFSALALTTLLYTAHTHRRTRQNFPKAHNNPSQLQAGNLVTNARSLTGIFYNYGGVWISPNYFKSSGFIICTELVLDAYKLTGFHLEEMIERDALANPGDYEIRENVRFSLFPWNFFAYMRRQNRLLSPSAPLKTGDVLFFRWLWREAVTHTALVSDIRPDGTVIIIDSSKDTILSSERSLRQLALRGYRLAGIGRILNEEKRKQ